MDVWMLAFLLIEEAPALIRSFSVEELKYWYNNDATSSSLCLIFYFFVPDQSQESSQIHHSA